MSNAELRKKLAALSFTEKIRILEKLRDRGLAIAKAGLRKGNATNSRDDSSKAPENH